MGYECGFGNDDERWKTNGCNKISSDDCFTEACRRGHDSVFVYEHLISGDLLLRAKDSFKCHNNRITRFALV
ncbi:hypothetical protein I0600191H4_14880 [Collinsella sp. i06-0019-1H4]